MMSRVVTCVAILYASCAADSSPGGDGGPFSLDVRTSSPDAGHDDAAGRDVDVSGDRGSLFDGSADSGFLDTGPIDASLPDADGGSFCSTCAAAFLDGFIRVEPGTFTMGTPPGELGRNGVETPQHQVTITRPFLLGRTEVTQREYMWLMGPTRVAFASCGSDCPMESVGWPDAVQFLNSASRLIGLEECYSTTSTAPDAVWDFAGLDCTGFRLPTEAEWEYAARGTSTTAFANGPITVLGCTQPDPVLNQDGWYCINSGGGPHSVALKRPSTLGFFDVHGNVWEWVHDWEAPYTAVSQVDPIGPPSGVRRIRRGGSYRDPPEYSRLGVRVGDWPPGRHYCVGFRAARTAPP
ncbi:MAG: formylglycine-generating enzyme family protein [Deltaproteobacteria bacterium]|nr:formylglycine-generating enzyme family protein [Deltaproteobacteria bacterium]